MSEPASRLPIPIGQSVRRRNDPSGVAGYIAGVISLQPYIALVRWPRAVSTFELFDDLIEVAQGLQLV